MNPLWIPVLIHILVLLSMMNFSVAEWLNHGTDITNLRSVKDLKISPRTISNLRLRWKLSTEGDYISATPAIADGMVYVPSWKGFLYAVNASSGELVWKQNLTEVTRLQGNGILRVNGTISRSTPTVVDNLLYVTLSGPCAVVTVTRSEGRLVWLTELDTHPGAVITMSGTTYMGGYYVGLSSLEEVLPPEQCCTFRGSMVKLDMRSGAVQWQTYMLPDNEGKLGGYSGAGIRGSSPSIDKTREMIYITTGNLYTAPLNVSECQERQNNRTGPPTSPDQCIEPGVYPNSIVALEMDSGRIRWGRQLGGYNVWFLACHLNDSDCPTGPNTDANFEQVPMIMSIWHNRLRRDVAVAVQNSGFGWALDRNNGDIVWLRLVGPRGLHGGSQYEAANDGKRVYTNIANRIAPSNQTTTSGAWVALDASTGDILWSTANPSNEPSNGPVVSVTNGVVFACSTAPNSAVYVMDARNGEILWSYDTGAAVYGGVSVNGGCIYLGNGYKLSKVASNYHNKTPRNGLYAFCL